LTPLSLFVFLDLAQMMQKKGGDIDLFVQTSLGDPAEISKAHSRFLAKLYAELGEQKIDVLIDYPNRKVELPIFAIALEQGIVL
jgi:hypothetical protein